MGLALLVGLPALAWTLKVRWLIAAALAVDLAGLAGSTWLFVRQVRWRGSRAPSMGPGLGSAIEGVLGLGGLVGAAAGLALVWAAWSSAF